MTKSEFIKDELKKLKLKGYSNAQSYAIANSMYNKAQQGGKIYAQFGTYNGLPIGNLIKQQSDLYGVDPINMQQIMQNQANSPQQNFDPNYQAYLRNGHTPAQPAQTLSPGNYNEWDINNDAIPDSLAPPEDKKQEDKKNTVYNNRVNLLNPYGSVSMDYALNFAGRGFGAKNPYQAGIGTGLSLLKGARSFLSGYGEGKENLRVANEMQDKQFDRERNYVWSQQGGKVKNSDVIAQNAIVDEGQGNINMEGNEFVLRNNGQVQPVVGEPHIKNGKVADGVNATLNDGDKVISDYVKLKPTDIKDLKERYDISLKRGITFAQAQKKIDQKIGIKKLEDEKATVLEKIEKAKNIKDKTTQELSTNALLKSFGTINEKINTLSGVRAEAADFIFNLQEQHPKKGDGTQLFDKNGKVVEEDNDMVAQQGGDFYITQLAKKHNIPLERAMELVKMQGGGEMEQQPQEQGGQEEQIMQMIFQMLQEGASPEQVVQTLVEQGVPQEVAVQMIQQVAGQQQGESSAPQEQGNPEQVMQAVAEALQSGAQPEEVVQELINQGVPQEEAIQMIQQVAAQLQGQSPQNEASQMAQQGGQKKYAQQGEYGLKAVQNYLSQWKDKADYPLEDLTKIGERFKPFFDKYGVKYTEEDFKTRKGLDNLAGKLQETISEKYPELALDYGTNIEPTRKGLQKLIDKGIIKRGEFGVETDSKGKVKIGSFNVLTPENQKLIKAKIDTLPIEDKKEYAKANYVDYESYFRTLDAKEIEFKDKAEYDKYLEDNKDKKIGDYFKTDKVGAYIKPIYKPAAKEEQKPQEDYKGIDNPQTQTEYKDRVKNIMPNFEPYIPMFGSIQPIAKQSVAFPRLEPIKSTIEPMLAEQERMRATELERVEQMGMTPQQQEALLAQGLASSQMAANDAISKTEQWNAQNQFATDQYNLGVTGKEQMMNNQYSADYQDKMMATLAALEESTRNQYRTQFLQGQSDKNYITNLNKFNTLSDQFAVTDSGVEYLNNKGLPVQDYSFLNKKLDDMTAEEVEAYKKMVNFAEAKKRATS